MVKTQSRTFDTGDINFTASAMSMGFPLNDVKPCSIVQRDNGKSYARFHLLTLNMEGSITMDQLSSWWSDPDTCTDPAYAKIMQMIKAGIKAGGLKESADWLDFIIEYLIKQGVMMHPKNMADIPDFIERLGEGRIESQLCSFAYNRNHAFTILKESKRAIMLTHGSTNHLRLDEHLPKYQQNELLARLRG